MGNDLGVVLKAKRVFLRQRKWSRGTVKYINKKNSFGGEIKNSFGGEIEKVRGLEMSIQCKVLKTYKPCGENVSINTNQARM